MVILDRGEGPKRRFWGYSEMSNMRPASRRLFKCRQRIAPFQSYPPGELRLTDVGLPFFGASVGDVPAVVGDGGRANGRGGNRPDHLRSTQMSEDMLSQIVTIKAGVAGNAPASYVLEALHSFDEPPLSGHCQDFLRPSALLPPPQESTTPFRSSFASSLRGYFDWLFA